MLSIEKYLNRETNYFMCQSKKIQSTLQKKKLQNLFTQHLEISVLFSKIEKKTCSVAVLVSQTKDKGQIPFIKTKPVLKNRVHFLSVTKQQKMEWKMTFMHFRCVDWW